MIGNMIWLCQGKKHVPGDLTCAASVALCMFTLSDARHLVCRFVSLALSKERK